MEILSTFHARVEYISVKNIRHSNQWEQKPPKPPLGQVESTEYTHPSTDPTHHSKHRHTNRETHRIGDMSVRRALTLILLVSDMH